MPVVINTNTAASIASNNLAASNAMLQRSLNRLSSGSKIVNASDDAGGVAVATRLNAAAKRSGAVSSNISNALSFLHNQDSALKTMGKMLERMSELQSMYLDTTKDGTAGADRDLYELEFNKLVTAYGDMRQAKFNGNDLFGATSDLVITVDESTDGASAGIYTLSDNAAEVVSAASFDIAGDALPFVASDPTLAGYDLSSVGGETLTITIGDVSKSVTFDAGEESTSEIVDKINASDLGVTAKADINGVITLTGENGSAFDVTATTGSEALGLTASDTADESSSAGSAASVQDAIASLAEARALNGADQSVLGYYAELNMATKTNLESAISKIMDVDVAEESTQLARWNTLVQAGTAMVAQANGTTQNVLTLLR